MLSIYPLVDDDTVSPDGWDTSDYYNVATWTVTYQRNAHGECRTLFTGCKADALSYYDAAIEAWA